MNSFMAGISLMGCWMASLFYLRFWKASKDRLFLIFATSFFLLGVDRIALQIIETTDENRPVIFLIRLTAFLVLIWGIWDKNHKPK